MDLKGCKKLAGASAFPITMSNIFRSMGAARVEERAERYSTVATLADHDSVGQQPARYYSQIYSNTDGCTQPKEADILASAVIRMT